MSSETPSTSPRYMGGQAVMEGVMMRGERSWAVAVRTPEGDIEIETHEAPTWAQKWSKVPLRRGIFLGYLFLIGQLKDIKRVFQYHGAEHKAIAAYENDVALTPESAQTFDTSHVRCGTNFLLTVMVITIVVYSFVGRPGWLLLILSRIILLPIIAGVSYEVIRFAAKHMEWGWVRVLMKPGLLLQKLTTREPTLEQVEVAIASLRAVLTAEQLAEVEARVPARQTTM